jgi:hypothetical protein
MNVAGSIGGNCGIRAAQLPRECSAEARGDQAPAIQAPAIQAPAIQDWAGHD